jgi:RHS repeat-associated protein
VTRTEYDALGRLVKGWSASRSSGGKSPNVVVDYQPATATTSANKPAAVSVGTLEDDGSYARDVTLYDGLSREVQKQSEAHGPGRIVVDTKYNDHGLVAEKTGAYLAKGEPDTELFKPRSTSLIPSWTQFRYDGLEREARASVYQGGGYKYATFTWYDAVSKTVNPPGSTAPRTRTYLDALGRTTSVRHFTQDASDATAGRTTTYGYDARGNRDKVTDPAGNVWSYTYDARGRVTSANDPDTGTTDTWYDAADRPNRVRNARGQETFTEYDVLGRPRYVRQGSATATPVKEYVYDEAPGGIGQPTSSKRHTEGGDYTNRVTGYDADYHPVGSETVIPVNSTTTGLSGTYAYAYTYTPTGKPQSVTLPAAGGLAKEKVVTRYNGDGLPDSTSGLTWYTADATYSPYGEVLRTVSGAQPNRVWTTNFVDPHTGRLQRTVADRETAGPHRITDSYYSYDATGTITSNARKLSEATGSTWDTQCFTYDVMGELAHAWTSKTEPTGAGTGCKAANGTAWGPRTTYASSSGPVTDAPDAASDATTPDASLASTLAAAAPSPDTVATGTTAYHQSFTFDWLGNRATLTEHDPADATKNLTYAYGYGKTVAGSGTTTYQTQPHTMTWISSTPSGKDSGYTYDATGNTTGRDLYDTTQNLTWTPENKLDSITDDGKKTRYVYDADGNRLLEHSPSGSTLYLGETELTTDGTGARVRASRAYAQPGAPTAVRTTTNGSTTGHKASTLISDHLGTANTSVELATGQPVTRRAFKPYGETRGTKPSTWPNKRGYLGVGIDDTATGLTHIGAREYDHTSGRFLSADPIIDLTDPLQMNGYAYANNSPVSHSDPTGLWIDDGTGHSEPRRDGGPTGPQNPKGPGVPRGGTGPGGCYYSCKAKPGWVETQTPVTNNAQRLRDLFYEYGPNGRFPDGTYWHTPIVEESGTNNVCFGREGHRRAYVFLMKSDDVAEAKRIAANYCVENFDACLDDAESYERGKRWETLPYAFIPGGRAAKGAAAGCRCFLAGTDVLMADGTTKDIEDVAVGDMVQATDPETGETGPRKVTRLIRTEADKHFNELSIATEDGIDKLTATHEHPFWSPSEQDWIAAGDLEPGMTLLTDDGDTVIVTGNRPFTKHARTYNLTVDDLHTYYVLAGATPVLVHNSNCTVYRTQTSHPDSQRLGIDANGNVSLSGEGRLHLNMSGDASHSLQFRGADGQVLGFDVDSSFVNRVRESALPQRKPRGFAGSTREWNQLRRTQPDIADPSVSPGLYGIPSNMFGDLMGAIVPGSGRVVR